MNFWVLSRKCVWYRKCTLSRESCNYMIWSHRFWWLYCFWVVKIFMKNIYCNVMLWVSVVVLWAVISCLCKILFLILYMLLQASFILFLSLYENLWINIHFKFMELVSFYKYAELPYISEKSKGEKNIENRVGRGLWRLCSLYSASRIQLCLCHLGKHLSNSSLGAHRDFTITPGNLFPRLWFLQIKGFFWYPTWISVAECISSCPLSKDMKKRLFLCSLQQLFLYLWTVIRPSFRLLFCRLNKPNSFPITV